MRHSKPIFVALILLTIVLQLPLAISDPEWLTGWTYRKSHTITGSGAGAQTDYQLRFQVEDGAGVDAGAVVYTDGKCESDFGDVRFTKADGTTLLDYWIQQKTDDDVTYIWVEVDSIPASPDTVIIYVYYGKVGQATTSNFDNTWLETDDFSGDPTIGRSDSGTASLATWDVADRTFVDYRFEYDIYIYDSSFSQFGCAPILGMRWSTAGATWPITHGILLNDDTDLVEGNFYNRWYDSGAPNQADTGTAWVEDEWYVISQRFDGTYIQTLWRQSTETFVVSEEENYDAQTVTHMGLGWVGGSPLLGTVTYDGVNDWIDAKPQRTGGGYVYFYIDNFRVGKYCDPEPAHTSWGAQEQMIETPAYLFGAGFNASSPYVSLYWKSNLTTISFFEIQNSTDKITWEYLGQNTTNEYHDLQVVNGTERYYQVRACNYTDPVWNNSTFTDITFETVYFIMTVAVAGDTIIMGGSGVFWIILIIVVPIVAYVVNKK